MGVDTAGAEDAEVFYVLGKFDQELVEKYLERAEEESFLEPDILMQYPGQCWVLAKLGLDDSSSYVQQLSSIKNEQNREGQILDSGTHAEVLRTLVLLEPDSDYTEKAVHCLIDNLYEWSVGEIAVGVLALTELDYERYQLEIYTGIDRLLDYKNGDGGFGSSKTSDITTTSWAIQAISRIEGYRYSSMQEATDWLKQQQNDDGSWTPPQSTTDALLALIAAGEGPKISSAEVEWNETLINQKMERTKPHFVHTSPIFDQRMHVKDIYAKIGDMLDSAKTEIKILSPFVDVMYEDIVNLAENNPKLSIKLITRPSRDIKGMRERIAKNVLDLLKMATRGNLRTNEILHARMIIVDDKEALISSADLTRDQLIDEFNAGIWVRDKETVKRATEFFDNIWEESETKK
ncbi:MAG: phospholipase D-like domain-containing protein [Candidatus Methanospirareceae archaeon]